jgi:protein-disulfide isomerase-like protein with CxxC motif
MKTFTVTYDYLCPFARIASESLVDAVVAGAPYDVTFKPFSLAQNHLDDDAVAVWDRGPSGEQGRGVLALFWSLAIRDGFSESFLEFHKSLFNAKHDDLADIGDEAVLRDVATKVGLDADAVAAAVETGVPAKTLAAEHTALVEDLGVFGVPTFIDGEEAVFVRFMERHKLDDLDKVIDMISWTNVNEFKRSRIPR